MEVVSDEEATDLYLARILKDLRNKTAFIPSSAKGKRGRQKTLAGFRRTDPGAVSLPAGQMLRPWQLAGIRPMACRDDHQGFQDEDEPQWPKSSLRLPEPEEVGRSDEMPGIKYSIDVPSQEIPDEEINAFYRSRTAGSHRRRRKGIGQASQGCRELAETQGLGTSTPAKIDDFVQDVSWA